MKKDNEKRVPELRFKGFDGDWEQRKLGELADFSKGSGFSKSDLRSSGIPIILYGSMYTQYQTVITHVDTFVERTSEGVKSSRGVVIVPASGETAEDISRASVVDVSGILLGGDLNLITPTSDINPTFLALSISNGRQKYEMTKRAQGKSVVHLHNSDLQQINLLYASGDEQTAITKLFRMFDVILALHERKLNLLKRLKKAYLQQLFPENGQKIPGLRFAGFTDDWEQRKLGEVAKISAGGDVDKTSLKDDGYPVIGNALTNRGIQGYYADKFRITAPAVTVTGRGEVGHAEPRFENFTPVVRVLAVESNSDPRFLAASINNHPLFVESTGVPQLTAPQLSKYKLCFPSIPEEKKIGALLMNLEDTIALHQCKLETFRNLKKTYLQKLFV